MLGDIHALKVLRSGNAPTTRLRGKIKGGVDLSGGEIIDLSGDKPPEVFPYTYIIYGIFGDEPNPDWYWCDANQQVESPPVLALWNGDTAIRDGLAFAPDGIFYQ